MTSEEYWKRLREERGIEFMHKSPDGNCMVMDYNQTPFEIPDPDELGNDERADICGYVLAHLDKFMPCA